MTSCAKLGRGPQEQKACLCTLIMPVHTEASRAPQMEDISMRPVDVHLIIFDICLIFRFPRLLMFISAVHLTPWLSCAQGDVGLDTFQARFVPIALLLLTSGSVRVRKSSASFSAELGIQNLQFCFKRRKETHRWIMRAVKTECVVLSPFNFS